MRSWADVKRVLEAAPAGAKRELGRDEIAHPCTEGAVRSIGWPKRQLSDWRFPPDCECRGLHVQEYPLGWVAHLDRVHPACDPIGHLMHDAPAVFVGGSTVVGGLAGGLVGMLFTRPRRGVLAGAATGALVAFAAVQWVRPP